MFRIGDFSKIARVSGHLLRYYDSIGLLSPRRTNRPESLSANGEAAPLGKIVTQTRLRPFHCGFIAGSRVRSSFRDLPRKLTQIKAVDRQSPRLGSANTETVITCDRPDSPLHSERFC